jgi:hypothetical protein
LKLGQSFKKVMLGRVPAGTLGLEHRLYRMRLPIL